MSEELKNSAQLSGESRTHRTLREELQNPSPETLVQIADLMGKLFVGLKRVHDDFMSNMNAQLKLVGIEDIQELFRHLSEFAATVRERTASFPDEVREVLAGLGDRGWYMTPEMPLSFFPEMKALMLQGDPDAVDCFMQGFVEEHLHALEESLCELDPSREPILRAAFRAHRAGDYALSIPVLFAQVDGLLKSATGQFFFVGMRGTSKPNTSRFVEALSTDKLWQAMLSPLCVKQPVNLNANERPAGMNFLNRHQVLHGEVLDYGTHLNGCRAISLLGYAGFVVRTLREDSLIASEV